MSTVMDSRKEYRNSILCWLSLSRIGCVNSTPHSTSSDPNMVSAPVARLALTFDINDGSFADRPGVGGRRD